MFPFANIMVLKADFDSGKIKSVKDLAGKTVAVTQPQSATWLMATYISDRAGILKQVNIRGLGDFATDDGRRQGRPGRLRPSPPSRCSIRPSSRAGATPCSTSPTKAPGRKPLR